MGHFNTTTATTLLLAFFAITCQSLTYQSQAKATENSEKTVNVNSIIKHPLAIANQDNRGSGR
ncbi:MAG TPA: hypothetical protein VIQ31_16850 [Phormidium sp.]